MISELLKSKGLKKTPIRIEMLELFLNHEFALSARDITDKLTAGHDRVTIYRALSSFEESGILHRASEDGQGVRYAIFNEQHSEEPYAEKHAHFICDKCHKTFCLGNVEIPKIEVSDDFLVDRINFTLSGTCKSCKDLTT